jgi:FKBP-type peptidyl-prolyl cis-trans isomerase SlyD
MVIDNNVVANLAYKIHLEGPQGDLVESVEEQAPREILFGIDRLISGFEKGLFGKGTGDFSFEIQSEDAFGPFLEELKVPVSKEAFMDRGTLREDLLYVNNTINMLDQNGRQLRGTIREIHEEDVLMDFNHPFAGKNLYVTGNVLSLRSATEYDIDAHSGCGCGGGSCGCGGGHEHHSHSEGSCCSTDSHGEEGCEVCGTPSKQQQESVASR